MTLIKTLTSLADDQIDDAYVVYRGCMEPLEIQAAQAHVMDSSAFRAMMLDQRITKVLVLDDNGELTGIGTYTTDLTAVTLISWKFYRHHWPDHYDRAAIFYVPFVAFAGEHVGAYYAFVQHIFTLAAPVRGKVAMDVCTYNIDEKHFIRAIALATTRLSGGLSTHRRVDTQNFWLFDVLGEDDPVAVTA